MVVLILLGVAGAVGWYLTSQGDEEPPLTAAAPTSVTSEPDGTPPTVRSVADIAHSTVMIMLVDGSGEPVCTGSGTVVGTDGTILTNAHVVAQDDFCPYEKIWVAFTEDAGSPPEPRYEADILGVDPDLDLAVIRTVRDLDGNPVDVEVAAVVVGDSDEVEIGDTIRILGYPSIGGDTITFTTGTISGFTAQNGVGERSWIKTDATIAGGNSGGTAINAAGELIGIPTQGGANSDSPVVDCRILTDTNADGAIDDDDQCVPFGGFLNGIRPVNLARGLLAGAVDADAMTFQPEETASDVDLESVSFYNPRFSLGVPDDDSTAPATFVVTASSLDQELCFWFDWTGMTDGAVWDAVWLLDDEVVDDYSFFGEVWDSGTDGEDYWVCATNDTGFLPGLYELAFFVSDELFFVEGIAVTSDPVPTFDVTFNNDTGTTVCYLTVNPAGSDNIGLDELGTDELLEDGGTTTLTLPRGAVTVNAFTCVGKTIASIDGLVVEGDISVDLGNP